MSIASIELELEAFREFALQLAKQDQSITLRDAWGIWINRDADIQAAMEAIEEMRNGDKGKPHAEVMEMLRAQTKAMT